MQTTKKKSSLRRYHVRKRVGDKKILQKPGTLGRETILKELAS